MRQNPLILKEFLQSLRGLERNDLTCDFIFFDNNDLQESSELLKQFYIEGANTFLTGEPPESAYTCTNETHLWNSHLIWKVAGYKDFMLEYALKNEYSHVFLVDSDLVLHPFTLQQLLAANVDIISEIFWTEWTPGQGSLPQIWMCGQYGFVPGLKPAMNLDLYKREAARIINGLKIPGVYEVGGLGACTLISRRAIEAGIRFAQIKNVDYWGEDRHFCIRAAVIGFKLYVDTYLPAYHIYRASHLEGLNEFKEKCRKTENGEKKIYSWRRKTNHNTLTLSMIVRNEANRYLPRVLAQARNYIDSAVIIDDASTDNTAALCRESLKDIPLTLITLKESIFHNEYLLRRTQWEETVKTDPDWILALDADEIFEDDFKNKVRNLINQTDIDAYCFRLYDFWNEEYYREDDWWNAHLRYHSFLIRYVPGFPYRWNTIPQHCGRVPFNVLDLPYATSALRLKHYGWAQAKDRQEKYERYMKLDPGAGYGNIKQYQSILDANPNLLKWYE